MRGVPTEGGSEAYLVRTSQRHASAPGTHPEDGCRRRAFFSSLLGQTGGSVETWVRCDPGGARVR